MVYVRGVSVGVLVYVSSVGIAVGGVGAVVPNRITRTLHAPALPPSPNSKRVVDSEQNSQDAPRASAAACPKQREGRRFSTEFSGLSTRQRRHQPKTRRRSSIPNRIMRTLHSKRVVDSEQSSQVYGPALPPAQNSERVVDFKQNS